MRRMLYTLSTRGKSLPLGSPVALAITADDAFGDVTSLGAGGGAASFRSPGVLQQLPGGATSPEGFQAVCLRGLSTGQEKTAEELLVKVCVPPAKEWKEAPT